MGKRTFQIGSVGWDIMIPLKKHKNLQKSNVLGGGKLEKYSQLIFNKIQPIFKTVTKNGQFYMILGGKISKLENLGRSGP